MTAITIAGVGPGDPELVTLKALNEARMSDVILVPRSSEDAPGMAERIMTHHLPDRELVPMIFPMTRDTFTRDTLIRQQLETLRPRLADRRIFFPVIGDSVLYSTGKWLIDGMMEVLGTVDVRLIPGISAHSSAACEAGEFLAMSDEALTIIPGTASPEKISALLKVSDNAVIYKPSAIHGGLSVSGFGTMICVEHSGDPDRRRIITGHEACADVGYMSVIMLKR